LDDRDHVSDGGRRTRDAEGLVNSNLRIAGRYPVGTLTESTLMHPKNPAPCGADETNQRESNPTRAGYVSTISPAPRGSSDAVTEARKMHSTFINGLEVDDFEVEAFLSICRKELTTHPRRPLPNSDLSAYVPFRNPTTGELIYVTPETAEFIRREGIAA
jgi:hypothetical protein